MARGSLGVKLIVGVVKAINKANKEDQKNRLRTARGNQKITKKCPRCQYFYKSSECPYCADELTALKEIKRRKEIESRALLVEEKRIAKEKERLLIAEEKERQLKKKEEERAQTQSEKDAKKNAELQKKDNIRRAKAELDEELSQGDACLRERCNERRNLRQNYIRKLLK